MASVDTGGGGGKKGSPQRINTRVDFTPMVDMNMLLLTFFMFCTTLSKPQIMNIVMPVPDDKILNKEDEDPDTKASQAVTIILGEKNKVYYFTGKPDYNDYTTLKETTYGEEGFRKILLEKNAKAVAAMREIRRKRVSKEITEEQFLEQSREIRSDKDNAVVVIKATEQSTYSNFVNAVDEMAICSVGRYAVVDMGDAEDYLLQNYFSKGEYGRSETAPATAAPKKAKKK